MQNKQKEDLGHGFNNINKHKIVNLVNKINIKISLKVEPYLQTLSTLD
jgi:hypothetical protein